MFQQGLTQQWCFVDGWESPGIPACLPKSRSWDRRQDPDSMGDKLPQAHQHFPLLSQGTGTPLPQCRFRDPQV